MSRPPLDWGSCQEQAALSIATDLTTRIAYSYDNSRLQQIPDAVARPQTTAQVAALVQWCGAHQVAVTARGRGTATTGAAVPLAGGLVISFEQMNRIGKVDVANRAVRVEPGATNLAVQQAAAAVGLFWPPDPTSAPVCTIGGNLACNAAGARAVKYGTPRENTLGLEIVTGSGAVMRTGCYTTKGVVGYDLTRLVIGSEGTLALITEATLKLHPLPTQLQLVQITFSRISDAAEAVAAIMAQPHIPYSLEFIDHKAIAMVRDYSEVPLPVAAAALLLVELEGQGAALQEAVAAVQQAVQPYHPLDWIAAADRAQAEAIWRTRKALSPALRKIAPKKINEDIVVPVSAIPVLLNELDRMEQRHGIRIVTFGHAGNGNLHVNLLIDPHDAAQLATAEIVLEELFNLTLKLNGTLSGEHGIGAVKREFVRREIEPEALALMHALKRQFDPAGILNPAKALPDLKRV